VVRDRSQFLSYWWCWCCTCHQIYLLQNFVIYSILVREYVSKAYPWPAFNIIIKLNRSLSRCYSCGLTKCVLKNARDFPSSPMAAKIKIYQYASSKALIILICLLHNLSKIWMKDEQIIQSRQCFMHNAPCVRNKTTTKFLVNSTDENIPRLLEYVELIYWRCIVKYDNGLNNYLTRIGLS